MGLLDFGSVGRLDRTARQAVGLLLMAVDRQGAAAAMSLVELLDRGVTLDGRIFECDVGTLLMRFGRGSASGDSGRVLVGMLRLVVRHGLSAPPNVAAAFRALGSLAGTLQVRPPSAQQDHRGPQSRPVHRHDVHPAATARARLPPGLAQQVIIALLASATAMGGILAMTSEAALRMTSTLSLRPADPYV